MSKGTRVYAYIAYALARLVITKPLSIQIHLPSPHDKLSPKKRLFCSASLPLCAFALSFFGMGSNSG